MNYLIVAAGGNGERMSLGYNKIFAKIGRSPIIYWTIKAFEDNPLINKIIISVKAHDLQKVEKIIKKYQFKKVIKTVPADNHRQESTLKILNWLEAQASDDDLIGVHNGVNPFVSQQEITAVYEEARKHKAALLAYPARDTVKIADSKNHVYETPSRQYCWYAQTPQVGQYQYLYQAFHQAKRDNFLGTDDTQLLERVGIKPKIVQCSHQNFKITYPEDLLVARKILKDRGKRPIKTARIQSPVILPHFRVYQNY